MGDGLLRWTRPLPRYSPPRDGRFDGPGAGAQRRAILRAALNAAVREEKIPRNPALSVKLAEPDQSAWVTPRRG